ncbi:MAG: RdgB/HAM1 family non-canonical purine NTP pyrophosphatase [Chloroflexi bacterium]|nr:RdgB/HAM1 family non-canonical purine NTP pyrophosphatase [Chloroflexota bacterium]MDL1884747.1 RdgB/HAM1 family non-canonical purine NTP pyrophosphatase [Anaerolineae bacterium CFX8]
MDVLIGTSNAGKLNEYRMLLTGVPVKLFDLFDVGLADLEVDENGETVEANARLKARAYAEAGGLLTLADDTGLFVDALGGAPGVYPARYGGPGLTMAQRRAKLLSELAGVPAAQRRARFVCVIAVANPQTGEVTSFEGVCEGHIAMDESEGEYGFGYDAIFIPQGQNRPWSHMPMAEKNQISHRGQAARRLMPYLLGLLEV